MVISIARKRPARKQLVRTLREHEEDVDGVRLTEGLIAERKAALHKCSDLRRELEAAPKGRDQARVIVRAAELFLSLGTGSEDLKRRTEAFLCVARSGLLSLCVDIALEAHEDMGSPPGRDMVEAGQRLLTSSNLEGAQGVTDNNWVRCTQFVGHHMRDHTLPTGIARNWKKTLRKWECVLENKWNRAAYCRKCLVDTTMLSFVRKAAEGSPDWAYRARQDLIKALQEYEAEEEEEEGDEEMTEYSEIPSDQEQHDSD
jgi:hypothetical protein